MKHVLTLVSFFTLATASSANVGSLTQLIQGPGGLTFNANGEPVVDMKLWNKSDDKHAGFIYTEVRTETPQPYEDTRRTIRVSTQNGTPSAISHWGKFDGWSAKIENGSITSVTSCLYHSNLVCVTANKAVCTWLQQTTGSKNAKELERALESRETFLKAHKYSATSVPARDEIIKQELSNLQHMKIATTPLSKGIKKYEAEDESAKQTRASFLSPQLSKGVNTSRLDDELHLLAPLCGRLEFAAQNAVPAVPTAPLTRSKTHGGATKGTSN